LVDTLIIEFPVVYDKEVGSFLQGKSFFLSKEKLF
jgi:hypothetical protein